jgi:hypothetical protein
VEEIEGAEGERDELDVSRQRGQQTLPQRMLSGLKGC